MQSSNGRQVKGKKNKRPKAVAHKKPDKWEIAIWANLISFFLCASPLYCLLYI